MDYASVDRASKACGPLFQWAESQIKYATILRKVKPLRDEVESLQVKSVELEVQQKDAIAQVTELEADIKQYKVDYATAIRETEIIRSEMDSVAKKCQRAEALLTSLEQENTRWKQASESFDNQMSTLIGDSLLAAAFLSYAGNFDHRLRKQLLADWSDILEALGIPFRNDLDITTYLSSPAEQMKWRSFGLPSDELAIQNAILLEKYNRYPLIIDPAGQAMSFLLSKFSSQKIISTSFLDNSFMKTLASAIRFGTPLLVQDVEVVDPILNPILNREVQRTGGRTLIRLGNEDIDFSPKFMIILITRNPLAQFPPDLSSRVTIVNFTITPASLESQTLSSILRVERPDVDKQRTQILTLQSEQNVKLRELEESLLNEISAVQGAILDDDTVINSLESLKGEAAELNKELEKTKYLMEDLIHVSRIYEPLATAMTSVYFTLEKLNDIHFMYQFSLQFFLQIVENVLRQVVSTSAISAISGDQKALYQRIDSLKNGFFGEISRRTLRCLKFEDQIVLVSRLAQIATDGDTSKELSNVEIDFLLHGSTSMLTMSEGSKASLQKFKTSIPGFVLDDAVAKQLMSLCVISTFNKLPESMNRNDVWKHVMSPTVMDPEKVIPFDWLDVSENAERQCLLAAMIIRVLRPERLFSAFEQYISSVFSSNSHFKWREHTKINISDIVVMDSKATIPLMLCFERGQDASSKVDQLATSNNKTLLQVAMGSSEGLIEADKIIAQGAKMGSWVLLRNVHLCIDWLNSLEKRLQSLNPHSNFRLFLTSEIHPKLPTSLLRLSEVIIYEASTGIKANLQRFYSNIAISRIEKQPSERCRLYGLVAWFHAVLQERLRYSPIGWTKRYEFTENDANFALDVIDKWLDSVSGQLQHIDPAQIPWKAIKTMLSESLYGGRIDHSFDQVALDSFIESIFNEGMYAPDAILVQDSLGNKVLTLPDGLTRVVSLIYLHYLHYLLIQNIKL